jgi:ABC-2 type transport system ATP-binding protein
VLEIRHLTKRYHAHAVVDDVSFTAPAGEVTGYLGPNGSGKSTTVKMATGLLTPSEGQILFRGQDINHNLLEYKALVGYVPEEPHLYSYLTGAEYLEMVGQLRCLPERQLQGKIERFLRLLSLYADRFTPLSSYSKGMRQKILIAAALLHDPEVVILDEPFSGLDINSCLVMRRLMQSLAAAGKTVLFSSHDLETVEKVCSSVVILHRGKVVASGSVAELRALMHLPNLEEIFAQLVVEQDAGAVVSGFVEAMQL